ncbi:hypothetical protein C8J57DRAFT_1250030 [Mycena rebaudengoi]|nr:hypothetical protein C8J57DRAFT_1250030 [Mycena rebaudengoi]
MPESQVTSHIVLFPRTFAEGTIAKSYTILSLDKWDYDESQEPVLKPINDWDAKKIRAGAEWSYLVEQELESGPVNIMSRGKCVVILAGFHSITCHFTLEGNMLSVPIDIYKEVIHECVPGNNKDHAKAARLQSFLLPECFHSPGSRHGDHKINIFAAVVTEDQAIIIMDFSHLTRLHVVSSSHQFQSWDMVPGSEAWDNDFFVPFPGGPDWALETDAALLNLDNWRQQVIEEKIMTPIIDILIVVDGPGGGIRRQLGNDLFYELVIHPDTPCLLLCLDDNLYSAYSLAFLHGYLGFQYNPFTFNTTSSRNFIAGYVQVYHKREVSDPADLYDLYQSCGLFNEDHIIGKLSFPFSQHTISFIYWNRKPYNKPWQKTTEKFKKVSVCCFKGDDTNRYHIILATPPPQWEVHEEDNNFTNVSNTGFLSTLGPASFREPIQNKIDAKMAKSLIRCKTTQGSVSFLKLFWLQA